MKRPVVAVLGLATLGLAGCGSSAPPPPDAQQFAAQAALKQQEMQAQAAKDVVEQTPPWYAAPPTDAANMYAVGTAVSSDMQFALDKASLANAQQTYDRALSLSKTGSGTQANLDSALATLRVAQARVVTSETRLSRRRMAAPISGVVQQIYFREGETVPAQRPVISILPPGNMKVRFFVPETELAKLKIGQEVRVTCDGCAADLTAKIYFIATQAEYTPPVIYSQD